MEGVNDTPSVRPIELTTNLFSFFFLNEIFCYGSNSVLESELIFIETSRRSIIYTNV